MVYCSSEPFMPFWNELSKILLIEWIITIISWNCPKPAFSFFRRNVFSRNMSNALQKNVDDFNSSPSCLTWLSLTRFRFLRDFCVPLHHASRKWPLLPSKTSHLLNYNINIYTWNNHYFQNFSLSFLARAFFGKTFSVYVSARALKSSHMCVRSTDWAAMQTGLACQ